MGRYAEVMVAQTVGISIYNGAGTNYLVQTPAGVLYMIYIDARSDLAFKGLN